MRFSVSFYCCYVFYRQSQEKPKMLFIPKKAILNDLFTQDYTHLEINFDKLSNLINKNEGNKIKDVKIQSTDDIKLNIKK